MRAIDASIRAFLVDVEILGPALKPLEALLVDGDALGPYTMDRALSLNLRL
jgi:hypothetical protein